MGNESAVIIPVPEVESIVAPLRWQYDRMARLGVPAHVTLLYPFCPKAPSEMDDEIKTLRSMCASIKAFPFSFTEVRRFSATAYLHPNEAAAFVQITRNLLNIWPDSKPYGGAHEDIVPHLTVADRVDAEVLRVVEETLGRQLPIHCVTKEVWLLTSDDQGMWSKRAAFPMRGLFTD